MFGRALKKENEQLKGYIAQLQAQIANMDQFIQSIGAGDVAALEKVKSQRSLELSDLDAQRHSIMREIRNLTDSQRRLESEKQILGMRLLMLEQK